MKEAKQPLFTLTFSRLVSRAPGSYGKRFRMHIACRPAETVVSTVRLDGLSMDDIKVFARLVYDWPETAVIGTWDVEGDGPFAEVITIPCDATADWLLSEWRKLPLWNETGFEERIESGDIRLGVSHDRKPAVDDAAVFVFHAVPVNDLIAGDTFSNVASYYDMVSTAVNDPVAVPGPVGQDTVPFYRVSEFDMDFLTVTEAAVFARKVRFDVACLAEEYRNLHRVQEDETIDV